MTFTNVLIADFDNKMHVLRRVNFQSYCYNYVTISKSIRNRILLLRFYF